VDLPTKQQRRWPSVSQWTQLYQVLTPKEKLALPGLIFVFLFSLFFFGNGLYTANTKIVPAKGGEITEGIIGSPRFLNSVYADTNDADRDLIQLLYSGILKYNSEGELMPDLAAEYPEITEGGKVITVSLKENILWHDGTPFGADDILFTINTILDPAYKSPIRANWIGVDIEKVSDHKIRFHLLDPYAPFEERLTLKILPMHIWGTITPENFALTPLNLQPVGTGPYQLTNIDQARSGFIHEVQLKAYDDYHLEGPFIESLTIRFFQNEEDIIREVNRGTLQSFSLAAIDNLNQMNNPVFNDYSFRLPRYFALFFNLSAPNGQTQTENLEIRNALQLLIDKEQLQTNVFRGEAIIVHSPFLPSLFGFSEPAFIPEANQEQALLLLEEQGYTKEQGIIGKPQLTGDALSQDLQKGDNGEDVRRLQQCLANPPAGGPEVYPDGTINGNFGPKTQQAVIRFQEKYADEVLAPINIRKGTGKAGPLTREKLNTLCFAQDGDYTPLTVSIATIDRSPLIEVAQELKRQWEAAGLQIHIQTFSAQELERDIIKPREYQTLLFGEVLGKIPDPFPFWHSTQTVTPGLNLSSYENKSVDKLLDSARKELDSEKRAELFSEAQGLLLKDTPALFLYDIPYRYFVSKEVQGVHSPSNGITDPSQRFAGITEWFVKTKRTR
jgi:ABC-type transport system substrate-binding protein